LKILHITASYKPAYIYGGPIYSVAALCEALVKKDWRPKTEVIRQEMKVESQELNDETESVRKDVLDINVYTTLANGKEELSYPSGELKVIEGVPVRYFNRWTKDHSHFSPSLLWYLWKNVKQFEAVHVHAWWNLISMGAVMVCLLKGVKPIISPRGMLGKYTFSKGKKLFHQIIGRKILSRCTLHATTLMEATEIADALSLKNHKIEINDLTENQNDKSEGRVLKHISHGEEVEKWDSEKRRTARKSLIQIYVIHNLVQLPEVLPKRTRNFDGTLKLLFLSRIHPKKGIELLLDTLSKLDFPFKLSIVGDGDKAYIKGLRLKAESLNLTNYVEWFGPKYDDEKFELLASHDLLVLPSFNENFGNIVIETLAIGTPVLVSDKVGLHHWISNKRYGYVCSLTVESMLEQLKKHIKLLKKMPKYSLDGRLNFNPDVVKYLEMYERV